MAQPVDRTERIVTVSMVRPPTWVSFTYDSFDRFIKDFDVYQMQGGDRSFVSLLGSATLSFVSDIQDYKTMDTPSLIKAIAKMLRPSSVHQILDQLSSLRMSGPAHRLDMTALGRYTANFSASLKTAPADIRADAVVDLFVRGLHPPRLRDRVRYNKPATFDDAARLARSEATLLMDAITEAQHISHERKADDRSTHNERRPSRPDNRRDDRPQNDRPGRPDNRRDDRPQDRPRDDRARGSHDERPRDDRPRADHPRDPRRDERKDQHHSKPTSISAASDSKSKPPGASSHAPPHTPWSRDKSGRLESKPKPPSAPTPQQPEDHMHTIVTNQVIIGKASSSSFTDIVFAPSHEHAAICSALIDSGSAISAIPSDLAPHLIEIGGILHTLPTPKLVSTPSQHHFSLTELITIEVLLAPGIVIPIGFYLMPALQFPVLASIIARQHGLLVTNTHRIDSVALIPNLISFKVTNPTPSPTVVAQLSVLPTDQTNASPVSAPVSNPDHSTPTLAAPTQAAAVPLGSSSLPSSSIPSADTLEQVLSDFREVFDDNLPIQGIDCPSFPISVSKNPQHPRLRSLPSHKRPQLDEALDDLLSQQIIEPAPNTSYLSPTVIVQKQDGSTRLCVDYSHLNLVTDDIHFPIEEPRHLLDALQGKAYFATLDLRSGFHQILLTPDAAEWTSFATHRGAFRYRRLPFGLKNAPRYFQAVMSNILRPILGKGAQVFIDDIIVFGENWDEFLKNLRTTLALLLRARVRLKHSKCCFGLQEVQYLGFVVNGSGLHLSPDRLQGLRDIALPSTKRALRSFLGLCNYYRSFVPHLADLVVPLQELLTKTHTKVCWSQTLQDTFNLVISHLAQATELSHPDYSRPLFVRCDASDLGVGGVLFQIDDNETERPISFVSKSFDTTQRNWSVMDRELYAILYSLDRFRHYIYGATFVLDTDHSNLLFLDSTKSAKLTRWRERLLEYSFVLRHIPGEQNIVADALSRIYAISEDPSHLDIFSSIHNSTVGHRKFKHCVELLNKKKISWPSMIQDLKSFLASCPACQKEQDFHSDSSSGTILCTEAFESIALDTIGPLPVASDNSKYILVVIDEFSRFVELIPTPDVTALSAAKAILQVFGRFGAPQQIKTDNGSQFTAQVIQELLALLHVNHSFGIPYRPQSNAIVERSNREILKHLRHLVYDLRNFTEWPTLLPLVQRIVNATPNSLTKVTPAQLVYGNRISIDRGLLHPFSNNSTEPNSQFVQELSSAQAQLIDRIKTSQHKYMQSRFEESPDFAVGSLVLIPFQSRTNKLSAKWQGPYEVISRDSNHTYRIRHLTSKRIAKVHVSSMTQYVHSDIASDSDTAGRDNNEWEVDHIVSHSGTTLRTLKFKIRWLGYDASEDSDLPLRAVNELKALDDYLVGHPALRRMIDLKEKKRKGQ